MAEEKEEEQSKEKKKKKKKKKNTDRTDFILEKLIFAIVLALLTGYLDWRQSERMHDLETLRQNASEEMNRNFQNAMERTRFLNDSILRKRDAENTEMLKAFELDKTFKQDIEKIATQADIDSKARDDDFQGQINLLGKETDEDRNRKISEIQLNYLTKQLEEFYWPIRIRLEKNNSLNLQLTSAFVGDSIEQSVILPNHLEIVAILQEKIHLAEINNDQKFLDEINHYVRHVHTYSSLRKKGYSGFPEDYNTHNGYRSQFYKIIKFRTDFFQKKYDELVFNSLYKRDSLIQNKVINSIKITDNANYKSLINTISKPLEPEKINLYRGEFEIKLAFRKRYFVKELTKMVKSKEKKDTANKHIILAFKDFNEVNDSYTFEIGEKVKTLGKWNFRSSDSIVRLSLNIGETIELNKEEIGTLGFQEGEMNFRITLKRGWKDGLRRKALIGFERWGTAEKSGTNNDSNQSSK